MSDSSNIPLEPVPPIPPIPSGPKKKRNWVVWGLLGCAAVVVIGGVVLVVGSMLIWKKGSSLWEGADKDLAGAISKITKTPVRTDSGNVVMETEQGRVELGQQAPKDMPSWVPMYPDVTPTGGTSIKGETEEHGSYHFKTADSVEKVIQFFNDKLSEAGFQSNTRVLDESAGLTGGEDEDGNRSVMVHARREGEETEVIVQFHLKK